MRSNAPNQLIMNPQMLQMIQNPNSAVSQQVLAGVASLVKANAESSSSHEDQARVSKESEAHEHNSDSEESVDEEYVLVDDGNVQKAPSQTVHGHSEQKNTQVKKDETDGKSQAYISAAEAVAVEVMLNSPHIQMPVAGEATAPMHLQPPALKKTQSPDRSSKAHHRQTDRSSISSSSPQRSNSGSPPNSTISGKKRHASDNVTYFF
jgi:hypothetical protein